MVRTFETLIMVNGDNIRQYEFSEKFIYNLVHKFVDDLISPYFKYKLVEYADGVVVKLREIDGDNTYGVIFDTNEASFISPVSTLLSILVMYNPRVDDMLLLYSDFKGAVVKINLDIAFYSKYDPVVHISSASDLAELAVSGFTGRPLVILDDVCLNDDSLLEFQIQFKDLLATNEFSSDIEYFNGKLLYNRKGYGLTKYPMDLASWLYEDEVWSVFTSGSIYWSDGYNFWEKVKYPKESAILAARTLKHCTGCVNCESCHHCTHCLNLVDGLASVGVVEVL